MAARIEPLRRGLTAGLAGDLVRLQFDVLWARSELAVNLLGGWMLEYAAPRPTGDRPVLLLPGFLGSGASLARLRRFLKGRGFDAHGWGAGRNLGPRGAGMEEHLDGLTAKVGDRIRALADRSGARVALVGQSLGGVYARELAMRLEPEIDRVIMLGAPAFHPYLRNRHNSVVRLLGYGISRQSQERFAGRWGLLHWHADRPSLPCVAICSPLDGVVDEASASIPRYVVERSSAGAPRENVRVVSSHIGMSVNPFVLLAVADRLVQDPGAWAPFDPFRYFPPALRAAVSRLYPGER